MNLNILSYIMYGTLTVLIIMWVGRLFHNNGRVFILHLFSGDERTTDTTNNLLLTLYYLLNIGYAIIQFSYWPIIIDSFHLITSIALKTGRIILILAALHYMNMLTIYHLSKKTPYSP